MHHWNRKRYRLTGISGVFSMILGGQPHFFFCSNSISSVSNSLSLLLTLIWDGMLPMFVLFEEPLDTTKSPLLCHDPSTSDLSKPILNFWTFPCYVPTYLCFIFVQPCLSPICIFHLTPQSLLPHDLMFCLTCCLFHLYLFTCLNLWFSILTPTLLRSYFVV